MSLLLIVVIDAGAVVVTEVVFVANSQEIAVIANKYNRKLKRQSVIKYITL